VRVRVVQRTDRELLSRGFAGLSARSRYLRFLSAKDTLSEHELDDLLSLDGRDRFALGAQRVLLDGAEGEGLGIARFARVPDRPALAEAAVTVTDAAQGKGLGRMLLTRLVAAARERGVERFTCDFDAANEQIWHFVKDFGPRTEVLDHGFVRAEVALPRRVPATGRGRRTASGPAVRPRAPAKARSKKV
jgi:GNAT superfamily N-acetyltransferase